MGITVNRSEDSAAHSRRAARSTSTIAQARRPLALALGPEGHPRRAAEMDSQSCRDWLHWSNAERPAGLVDKSRSGRLPWMSAAQSQALDAIVETGPDGQTDGVVRICDASSRTSLVSRCASALSALP